MLGRKNHGITETVCGLCLPPKTILRVSVVKGEGRAEEEGWAGGKGGLEGKGELEEKGGLEGKEGVCGRPQVAREREQVGNDQLCLHLTCSKSVLHIR